MRTALGSLGSCLRGAVMVAAVSWALAVPAVAAPITYDVILSGPAESPPNASPGTGHATVILDTVAHTLTIDVTFSGLLGTTTASHIHCCTLLPFTQTAGVATTLPTFSGFPLGVDTGSYFNVFDTTQDSTWNPAFVANVGGGSNLGAEAALAAGLASGRGYLNIHSNMFPGGEIRAFLTPVPEPSSLLLLGLGALTAARRRRSRIARG